MWCNTKLSNSEINFRLVTQHCQLHSNEKINLDFFIILTITIIKPSLWISSVPYFDFYQLRLVYRFRDLKLQMNLAPLVLMNQKFMYARPPISAFLDKLFNTCIMLPYSVQPAQDFHRTCVVYPVMFQCSSSRLFLCSPLQWKPEYLIDVVTAGSRGAYGKPWELLWRKVFHLREIIHGSYTV